MAEEGEIIQEVDPITGQPIFLEYSVSKGWQPVDLGTMAGNLNYSQDLLSTGMDPAAGILQGNYDPSAYAPIQREVEVPYTPLWQAWSSSQDQTKAAVAARIAEGATPHEIAEEMITGGFLPDPDSGEPADARAYEAFIADAGTLRDEFGQVAQYEQQMANPQFDPNPNSQRFLAAGLPDPSQQYTDEQLNPLLPFAQAKAEEGELAMKQFSNWRNKDAISDVIRKNAAFTAGVDEGRVDPRRGPDTEGWTNISRDGSPLEQAGAAMYGAAKEVPEFLAGLPNMDLSPTGLANAAGGALGWLTRRPDNDEDDGGTGSEGLDKLIAQVARKNEAAGGAPTGVGGRVWAGLDRALGGDGRGTSKPKVDYARKRRDEKKYGDAAYQGWMDQLAAHRAQRATDRVRASGVTPTRDVLMGRMGL